MLCSSRVCCARQARHLVCRKLWQRAGALVERIRALAQRGQRRGAGGARQRPQVPVNLQSHVIV